MIVLGTVLLNATTARLFARIVGVFLKKSEGILIVGASEVSRLIGNYLEANGRHVVLIDSNQANINKSQEMGLEAINTNIYSESLKDNIELNDVGYLMALTGNTDINNYAINKFSDQFGENGSFRLISEVEMNNPTNSPAVGLFSQTDDFQSLTETAKQYPIINEIKVEDKTQYLQLIEQTENNKDIIPLFVKSSDGDLEIISSNQKEIEHIDEAFHLVYLGKPIQL